MRPLATDQWLAKGKEELGRVLRVSLSFMCVCVQCVCMCVYVCLLGEENIHLSRVYVLLLTFI